MLKFALSSQPGGSDRLGVLALKRPLFSEALGEGVSCERASAVEEGLLEVGGKLPEVCASRAFDSCWS